MTEEVTVPPPNIWRYEEAAAAVTEGVNLKEFKPIGQFYADAALLCKLYGLKLHPVFREAVGPASEDADGAEVRKEPTTISIQKYRLDPNTLKVLFKVLEGCPHIQTLKL